jgi:hypothetical protein
MDTSSKQLLKAHPPVALLTILAILAAVAVAGGVMAALVVLIAQGRSGGVTLTSVFLAVGCVLSGLVVGCILWAIAHIIRRQSRMALLRASARRTLRQRGAEGLTLLGESAEDAAANNAALADAAMPTSLDEDAGWSQRRLLQEVLAELRELNENLLLSAEQREAKRQRRQERLSRQFAQEIDRAIEGGRLDHAEKRLEEFLEEVPEDPAHQRLHARLIEARDAAKAQDIEAGTRQVYDLMAVSSFEQAEQTARELLERYPDEPHLAELLDRVRREGAMFHGERRDRLRREVQRHAESRRWRLALEAAQRFIEAFPKSVDAEAIRAMLPTIEDNARIEQVRQIRDRIRDLIERRRYAEALEAAEDVIRRFPGTRAAEELGRQLDRLRELSKTPAPNRPNGP